MGKAVENTQRYSAEINENTRAIMCVNIRCFLPVPIGRPDEDPGLLLLLPGRCIFHLPVDSLYNHKIPFQ